MGKKLELRENLQKTNEELKERQKEYKQIIVEPSNPDLASKVQSLEKEVFF